MRTIVVIPTYNEVENIGELLREILELGYEALVVDDDSPDGTAEVVRGISSPRAHLLLREENPGRGSAGKEGFVRALELGAERIVEMDGDFSHDPREIPSLLSALEEADIVIGSRFLPDGDDLRQSHSRKFLTRLSTSLVRLLLNTRVRDVNSGFRAYRREALEAIEPHTLSARGPEIVQEVLIRAIRRGLSIREVPIKFHHRKAGYSKLTFCKLLRVLFFVIFRKAND